MAQVQTTSTVELVFDDARACASCGCGYEVLSRLYVVSTEEHSAGIEQIILDPNRGSRSAAKATSSARSAAVRAQDRLLNAPKYHRCVQCGKYPPEAFDAMLAAYPTFRRQRWLMVGVLGVLPIGLAVFFGGIGLDTSTGGSFWARVGEVPLLLAAAGLLFAVLLRPPTLPTFTAKVRKLNQDDACNTWVERWRSKSTPLLDIVRSDKNLGNRMNAWLKLQRLQHYLEPLPIDDYYRHQLRNERPKIQWKE